MLYVNFTICFVVGNNFTLLYFTMEDIQYF